MSFAKLPLKQTKLKQFFKGTVNSASLQDDVLTLTTQEGKSFRIFAGTKVVECGDKGAAGDSAYDIAKNIGKTDKSLEAWLATLVGNKGAKGAKGAKGTMGEQGTAGKYPEIIVNTVKVSPDISEPSLSLTKRGDSYEMQITVPGERVDHSVWFNMPYEVIPGDYVIGTANTKAAATLTMIESYLYKLDVTVPSGAAGFAGTDSVGKDAVAPDIVFNTNTVNYGSAMTYGSQKKGDTLTVNVNIPRGPKGVTGSEQRQRKIVYQKIDALLKIVTDIAEIQNPVAGFCTIEFTNMGHMFGKAFGWSWRNRQGTRQVVFFDSTSVKSWYYRNGPPTGDVAASINEGWIKL